MAWKHSSIWWFLLLSPFQQFFFIFQHIFFGFHFSLLYGLYPWLSSKLLHVVFFIGYLYIFNFLEFAWNFFLLFVDFCTLFFKTISVILSLSLFFMSNVCRNKILWRIYLPQFSTWETDFFKYWRAVKLCMYLLYQHHLNIPININSMYHTK